MPGGEQGDRERVLQVQAHADEEGRGQYQGLKPRAGQVCYYCVYLSTILSRKVT